MLRLLQTLVVDEALNCLGDCDMYVYTFFFGGGSSVLGKCVFAWMLVAMVLL